MNDSITLQSQLDENDKITISDAHGSILVMLSCLGKSIAIELTPFEAEIVIKAIQGMATMTATNDAPKAEPVIEAPEQLPSEDVCLNCGKMLTNHITGYQGVYCSDDCMKQSGDSEVVEIVDRSDLTIKTLREQIVDIRNAGSIFAEKVLETESGIMVYVSPDVWQKEHKILVSEFATKRNSLLSIKRDSENHYWWLIDTLPF